MSGFPVEVLDLEEGTAVNSIAAGVGHAHLTGHHGGGSDQDYQCEECGFEIADGVVKGAGSIVVRSDLISGDSGERIEP